MRKLMSIMLVAFMAVTIFTSCNKKNNEVVTPQRPSVDAIAGTFNVQDGDLNFKSTPVASTRTWTMQARNSSFYGNVPFANVDGSEFIVNSAAYNFWSVPANNPITFAANQAVYSNLTPDEDLRLITETKVAGGAIAYLGMLDFNPGATNFPLTLHGFRLGDELIVNADALTTLPGGQNLIIKVGFDLAPIDLVATEALSTLTGNTGTPNGTQFCWNDIQYGTNVAQLVTVGSGDFYAYDGLTDKVMGTITITITETGSSLNIVKTVQARGAGLGLKLTIKTGKIGWYDSQTINFSDTDITIDTVDVVVN